MERQTHCGWQPSMGLGSQVHEQKKVAWAQAFTLLSVSWLWRAHEQLFQALVALTSSPCYTAYWTVSQIQSPFFKLLLTILELGWSSSTVPSPWHGVLRCPSYRKQPKNHWLTSTNPRWPGKESAEMGIFTAQTGQPGSISHSSPLLWIFQKVRWYSRHGVLLSTFLSLPSIPFNAQDGLLKWPEQNEERKRYKPNQLMLRLVPEATQNDWITWMQGRRSHAYILPWWDSRMPWKSSVPKPHTNGTSQLSVAPVAKFTSMLVRSTHMYHHHNNAGRRCRPQPPSQMIKGLWCGDADNPQAEPTHPPWLVNAPLLFSGPCAMSKPKETRKPDHSHNH